MNPKKINRTYGNQNNIQDNTTNLETIEILSEIDTQNPEEGTPKVTTPTVGEIKDLTSFESNINTTAQFYKDAQDRKEEESKIKSDAGKIIGEIARINEVSYTHAAYALMDIYQKGGHLKNVQNRTSYVNGMAFSKQIINQAMIRLNIKHTHRAIARSIRDSILDSSKVRDIPGNLFPLYRNYLLLKDLKLDDITLQEHSYYCTDFQIDNPKTPLEVAKFLTTRSRIRNTSKKS
jgi:hypothetical protein